MDIQELVNRRMALNQIPQVLDYRLAISAVFDGKEPSELLEIITQNPVCNNIVADYIAISHPDFQQAFYQEAARRTITSGVETYTQKPSS